MPIDPTRPKFVLYTLARFPSFDDFVAFVTKCNAVGVNVIILSFIFFESATSINQDEVVQQWTGFTAAQRQTIRSTFKGSIMVSHGGASGSGYITSYAAWGLPAIVQSTWAFVAQYGLDGVDVDYENIPAAALSGLTVALAGSKPAGALLTMAPQASWGPIADHRAVYALVGDKIDWWNLQLYNQTARFKEYAYAMINSDDSGSATSVRGLITGKSFPGNAYCTREPGGVCTFIPIPAAKIVIGGCVNGPAGCSDSVSPDITASFVQQAARDTNGYFTDWLAQGGTMVWCYEDALAIDSPVNADIWASMATVVPLFGAQGCGSGPSCGTYGACTQGQCVCTFGYSGTDCSTKPKCQSAVGAAAGRSGGGGGGGGESRCRHNTRIRVAGIVGGSVAVAGGVAVAICSGLGRRQAAVTSIGSVVAVAGAVLVVLAAVG